MIWMHRAFLFHRKNIIVTVLYILVNGFLFAAIAPYSIDEAMFMNQETQLIFEYSNQGMMILKLGLLFYTTYFILYAFKMNDYDIYIAIRYAPLKVLYTKIVFVIMVCVFVSIVVMSLFLLYLIGLPHYVSIGLVLQYYKIITLFVLYYSLAMIVLGLLIQHIGGVFIPIIGYFIGMIFVDIKYDGEIGSSLANYIQIITPDIIYFKNGFSFLFGDIVVVTGIVILGFIVIHIARRKDWL